MEITERLRLYLNLIKRLALLLVERRGLCADLCPYIKCEDEAEKLKELVKINRSIAETMSHIEAVENDVPPLGSKSLFQEPTAEERATVALLVLSRLSKTVSNEFSLVGEISENVAGDDPCISLTVRQLFSQEGSLRKYVRLERHDGETLDMSEVNLTDITLAWVLGNEPTDEDKALGIVSSNQRQPYRSW